MHLVKPLRKPSLLLPLEQLYILDFSQRGMLVPEQHTTDTNPLVRLAISTTTNPSKM
jgi:hypothetical protein